MTKRKVPPYPFLAPPVMKATRVVPMAPGQYEAIVDIPSPGFPKPWTPPPQPPEKTQRKAK